MTAIPPGENAEDCASCRALGNVTVYPWICPGHPEPVAVVEPEPLDLRTRVATALADEDRRNWGYDHGFEAGDPETLAFADAAIAVVTAVIAKHAPIDLNVIGMDLELAELSHPVSPGDGDGTTRLIHEHVPALLAALAEQATTIEQLRAESVIEARRTFDLEALVDRERAEARAEIERLRRERTHGTTRRGCRALDCWAEFELFPEGEPFRGAEWLRSSAIGGYLCPLHAPVLAEHAPQWRPDRLVCPCGWTSPAVRHRAAGVELWLDHAHEVVEGTAQLPPLPTTEDYRVVLRDEDSADEPHGGWQQIGSTVPTLAAAVEQMATRRRHRPEWDEMRVWRRQDVWSVAAAEDRDASRAPESPADPAAHRATPDAH